MTETHSATCKRNLQCLVIHLDGICSWKNDCSCGINSVSNLPTQPVQEKEMDYDEFMHLTKPTQDIESWEESVRQARHLATTRPQLLAGLLKEIETARTQGAEAAVEFLKKSELFPFLVGRKGLTYHKDYIDSILEQAKKA